MLQKNHITFYRENELWKAKEKHGNYCSVQARDEKGLDQDNDRNGEKYTDSKCILKEDKGLTNESDLVGKGKGITKKNALGFWLK